MPSSSLLCVPRFPFDGSLIVQSKRPFDSYSLQWEGRRRVGEGIHCTALEQVTRKVLDAYTVRTRVRVHAYGYTFIARYAHDSTVTVRGSSVHLAVAMAFACLLYTSDAADDP